MAAKAKRLKIIAVLGGLIAFALADDGAWAKGSFWSQSGPSEKQVRLDEIAREQCRASGVFPILPGRTLTLRSSRENQRFGPAVAAIYRDAYAGVEPLIGVPIQVGVVFYLIEVEGGRPDAFFFKAKAPGKTMGAFAVVSTEAPDDEKLESIKRQIASCSIGTAAGNFVGFIHSYDAGRLWFYDGLRCFADFQAQKILKTTTSEEREARWKTAAEAFLALKPQLWNWQHEKGETFSPHLGSAALGAFLWMEEQTPGAVASAVQTLKAKKRLATPDEIFEAVEKACGKDIRDAL